MKHLAAMAVQVLWFLLTPTLAFSYIVPLPLPVVAASLSGIAQPSPMPAPRPDCPRMCGTVNIPYPFGIGVDCAWPGIDDFNITCNHSFNPPRAYLSDFEVISISLEAGEMRVFSPVSYKCYNSSNTTESNGQVGWSLYLMGSPFLISPTRNVFTAIGCDTLAFLEGREDSSFFTGCITSCNSLHEAAEDGEECTGLGCCQTGIPRNLTTITVDWSNYGANFAWKYSPCGYAFIAEKGWYHFKRHDLTRIGNKSFTDRVGNRTIPVVLDWAIRGNGSCQIGQESSGASGKPTAPACASAHSHCVDVTGPGYLCNCSEGYTGNPYVVGGCTNINECDLRKLNPMVYKKMYPCGSGSTCQDTQGDYKCKCKFGHRGDGRTDKGCQPIFPAPVAATIATFVALVLAFFVILLLQRRRLSQRFKNNGGEILKRMEIRNFTEKDVKKMTNNYKKPIGEGNFGKVFIGTIDGSQQVAVKCSVKKDEEMPKEEFVNEITIQFRFKHTNLVRLIGCCLETDVPKLVFEYIPNGSLEDILHVSEKQRELSLSERMDIAIGSAEALSYMHSHGEDNCIHGDVKPGNILLDDNLVPKVSDFGSSRLLLKYGNAFVKNVRGDWSYMDPVYMKTNCFRAKSDVYSFGVVLLELITRKTAMYGDSSLPIDFVKSYKEAGNGRSMYDREIFPGDAQSAVYTECLDKIGELAVKCLKEDMDERPTMAAVVEELKHVKLLIACEIMV
ncbi:hypothetical protein SEVIR_8G159900v4 [Setaria viridis]|uniref:Protein kinase domain-containing protein n=1 Tax=Setaria viridis TaxID=4556 RepID=A0A4U6TU00_SETVI|nr:wall-associated receptor kinase 2-like [Setaria viridis]TKW01147.1 hypothetical protein SEVIR_8G159900v2 [Setaria viridis]